MGTYFSSTSIADKKNEMQLINTILQVKQQERMHRMQEVWLVRTSWVGAQGYILYTQLKMGRYSWIALIPSLLLWFGSSQLMRRHHFLDVIDGNQMNFLVEKTGLFKTWDNKLATDVVHPNKRITSGLQKKSRLTMRRLLRSTSTMIETPYYVIMTMTRTVKLEWNHSQNLNFLVTIGGSTYTQSPLKTGLQHLVGLG